MALLIGGCTVEDPKSKVSHNLEKLRETIELRIPVTSVRWEISGTPEYSGGVPGPTDYITLIAELQSEGSWFDANQYPADETYIVPEAPRSWISPGFRQMLEESKSAGINLSRRANCRKFTTTLKKTGKPVHGFTCGSSDHALLYLTLT